MSIELRQVSLRVGAETHIYETDLKLVEGGFNILLGTTLSRRTFTGSIVDLGCGSGIVALRLAVANPSADLVLRDDSYQAVASAEATLTGAGLADRADIAPVPNMHTMRHTYATRLIEAGVPLHEISDILGHDSVLVTARTYIHTTDERKRTSAHVIDNLLTSGASSL